MNIGRSKIVAIVTGFISIFICIGYLLLITIFDFRTFLNDQLTNIIYEPLWATTIQKILILKNFRDS